MQIFWKHHLEKVEKVVFRAVAADDPIVCRYLVLYISYQHHSYFISQNFEKEVSEENLN